MDFESVMEDSSLYLTMAEGCGILGCTRFLLKKWARLGIISRIPHQNRARFFASGVLAAGVERGRISTEQSAKALEIFKMRARLEAAAARIVREFTKPR